MTDKSKTIRHWAARAVLALLAAATIGLFMAGCDHHHRRFHHFHHEYPASGHNR